MTNDHCPSQVDPSQVDGVDALALERHTSFAGRLELFGRRRLTPEISHEFHQPTGEFGPCLR